MSERRNGGKSAGKRREEKNEAERDEHNWEQMGILRERSEARIMANCCHI